MGGRKTGRILIVDDSAAVRASLESLIEPYGFEVEHAEDGASGLRRCGSAGYDLLLLDLHMPVLDGPTMLRFLRQWGNQTPVILVTSASDSRLLSSVIKLGRVDYVCKPFDPGQIHAALSRVLGVRPDELVAETPRVLVAGDGEGGTVEILRGSLPVHVAVDSAVTAEEAEAQARRQGYRLVLVDGIPGGREAAAALARRLGVLQPEAGFFLLDDPERTSDASRRTATGPFDGALPRPPEARVVKEFLYPNCLRNLVTVSGRTLSLAAFRGNDEDVETYFRVAQRRVLGAVQTMPQADAGLRIDLSRAPAGGEPVARLVNAALQAAAELGAKPAFVVSAVQRAALDAAGQRCPAPLLTPDEKG